jgi:transcriptional antiterminator NusG
MSKKWFVVHAYSGFEKSVQRALVDRIKRSEIAEQFGKILVPVEEVVEMKAGQKAISERKFFPGYVLVEMEMTDDSWHLVKSTPKVTGFVGGTANKPTPITQKEVDAILRQVQEGVEKPRPKVLFEMGEAVRVKEGPFTDFPRQRGGRELREEQAPGVGHDLRPLDAGGARFLAGREGVVNPGRIPRIRLHPTGEMQWRRKSSATSSCRCLQARRTRARRSVPHWDSAASTSWNSARPSTRRRRRSSRACPSRS